MTDILISYITNGVVNILMLLFLLYLVSKNIILSALETRLYIITIFLTVVVMTAELATSVFDTVGNKFRIANIIANIIGFSISLYIPFVLAALYDKELIMRLKYILIPVIINSLLIVTSPWTGWMFNVTINNEYSRGPFFPFYTFVYLYGFVILVHANYKLSLQFVGVDKLYLNLLYTIFIIGSSIQIYFPIIHSTWHCVTIVLVLYYIFQRERQFKYDVVTGLLNRSAFETRMRKINKNDRAVIIVFDLNRFKKINDTYGHQVGDSCIKIAGNVINNSFKQVGDCYRIGGDEFCVLGNVIDENIITECIESMVALLEKQRESCPVLPHISYGYSIYEKSKCADVSITFKEADLKMYEYKMSPYMKEN